MGNTYAYVIEQSEKEFMKQWAKIVVTLERAVPQVDAQKYLEEYSIGLGPSGLCFFQIFLDLTFYRNFTFLKLLANISVHRRSTI